ncbi:MAG TPA: phosphoribosylamine--glycine ligase, partial [Candidatus Sumerlaeota bacterium]|nr:phosphoribosylamine--glycine ligase [Candidatus Sumerlaeota bacterium]
MRILIVGGGGREHALAWKIARSPLCDKLFCAPGNPGIGRVAQCVPIPLGPPFHELTAWCREQAIDLVVIGPERPLADGIVDALAGAGIKAFGPTRDGAQLEASKTFAKDLMREAGIPTAQARTFSNLDAALAALDDGPPPYVIKAVGLAEGKGVTVARTRAEAEDALRRCLCDRVFGQAGAEVLIEEFLAGEEASLLAFTDGRVIQAMDSAQDHKPLLDGDQGPNTGGMGAYSPAPVVTPAIFRQCVAQVLEPCLAALRRRGIDYRGVIYAGLMITADGPRVVEFNCRFGDPETQALLPRLQNDLVEVLLACVEGRLADIQLRWRDD